MALTVLVFTVNTDPRAVLQVSVSRGLQLLENQVIYSLLNESFW